MLNIVEVIVIPLNIRLWGEYKEFKVSYKTFLLGRITENIPH